MHAIDDEGHIDHSIWVDAFDDGDADGALDAVVVAAADTMADVKRMWMTLIVADNVRYRCHCH